MFRMLFHLYKNKTKKPIKRAKELYARHSSLLHHIGRVAHEE